MPSHFSPARLPALLFMSQLESGAKKLPHFATVRACPRTRAWRDTPWRDQ